MFVVKPHVQGERNVRLWSPAKLFFLPGTLIKACDVGKRAGNDARRRGAMPIDTPGRRRLEFGASRHMCLT
jgi:hypothetical protein